MKRVAIPIETKVREFDGKLWLALNLVKDGHKIALGHRGDIHYTFDLIKPDIYLQKSAVYHPDRLKRVSDLTENGTTVLVLDEEGGVIFSKERYVSSRLSEQILDETDYFLAWGEAITAIVSEGTAFPEKRIVTTGNPRFDLLNRKLRSIYNPEASEYRSEFGEYILINTKFGMGNNKSPEEFRRSMKQREIPVNKDLIAYQKRLVDEFISLIERLSQAGVAENIVVRPHPSENFETYTSEFLSDDDVHVRHEGDVRPWILGSSAVIHNSCTTGIESAMLNVPVFTYRPIRDEEYDSTLPNLVSETVIADDELVGILRQMGADETYSLNDEQESELKRFFHNVDTDATQLIRGLIDDIDGRADGDFEQFRSRRKQAERLVKKVSLSSLLEGPLSTEKNQKFEGLSTAELRDRIELFGQFLDIDEVHVQRIAPWKDAFWLTPA